MWDCMTALQGSHSPAYLFLSCNLWSLAAGVDTCPRCSAEKSGRVMSDERPFFFLCDGLLEIQAMYRASLAGVSWSLRDRGRNSKEHRMGRRRP